MSSSFRKCLGSLTSLANHVTLKMQETRPTVIVLIQEDLNVKPLADIKNVITKAAHSPQLF